MKKTLCILLALLFSLGTVFAGCSEKQGETTDAAAPTGSAEAAVSPGEEAEDETEFVDPFAGTDLGGRDFRVYTSVDTSDATNGDAFIRGSGEINGEAVNDAVFERNAYVSQLLNVNLAFEEANYSYGNAESSIKKLVQAGDDQWDVMANDIRSLANLSRDGYIRNVYNSTIFDLTKTYWYADAMRDCQFLEGGMYLLIGDYFTDALQSTHALFVNETMLNDYYGDTEYINAMVFDGKWTFDNMIEIVDNCKSDLNGDGKMTDGDQFGFMCLGMWGSMVPFVIGTDIQFIERTETGIEFCFNNERSVTILEKLNELFYQGGEGTQNSGTQTAPSATSDAGGLRTHFANGEALIMGYNRLGDLANMRDIEFGVGIIPYPKLDEAQANYVSSMHDVSEVGAIPGTLPDTSVEFCHTVLEVLARETGRTVIPKYYEEGLKVKYSAGQDDAKMIDLIHDAITGPFPVAYDSMLSNFMLQSTFSSQLQSHSSDFASAYKKMEKAAKKMLDKVSTSFANNLANGN